MELHNASDLTHLTQASVALLVDAGWIEITREWWRCDCENLVDFRERVNKGRANMVEEWNFPASDWIEVSESRVPDAGIKSSTRIVAEIDSDVNLHVVEFTLTKKARVRNYR